MVFWVGDGGGEYSEGIGADEVVEGWKVEVCVSGSEIHFEGHRVGYR